MKNDSNQGINFISNLSKDGMGMYVNKWPYIDFNIKAKSVKAYMSSNVLYLPFVYRDDDIMRKITIIRDI